MTKTVYVYINIKIGNLIISLILASSWALAAWLLIAHTYFINGFDEDILPKSHEKV
jgi:hypothetical protein